jgi:hypothetical protein
MPITHSVAQATENFERTAQLVRNLPFDLAREQYGLAVRLGLVQRSMLAWSRFERSVDLMEKVTWGPLARRV